MKKVISKSLLIALLLVIPLMSIAQNRGDRATMEERRKQQSEQLKKELKLNKKQAAQFDKINEKFDKKRQEMFASGRDSGDREGMREKMTKMREDHNKELKEILTEKQFKKYETIQQERRRQMGERGRQGRGGGRR